MRFSPLVGLALASVLSIPSLRAQQAGSDTSALPPRAVQRVLPMGPMIRRAFAAGTRDSTGAPGRHYWQQSVDYRIDASLDVATAVLHGRETITLHNTSPDTLKTIVLRLFQNYFRPEVDRNDYVTDITGGMLIEHLAINGTVVDTTDSAWQEHGTIALVRPPAPIAPGADATVEVAWHFTVPNVPEGQRGERMGRWDHELYQVAQWYPQIAMYDDLRGWDADPYLGTGEFYNQFGRFDVRITLPAGWLVGATGTLANPAEVVPQTVRSRLDLAMKADTTVHVVTPAELKAGKATVAGDSLTWHFTADTVNDFAFATSRNFVWDATHANAPAPVLVQEFYYPDHIQYHRTAQMAKFALEHHAKYVMPYAFPQASQTDGPEGGMEYPMIIFSGANFGVTTHELGHEWFPMMVGSNETWYGWQDEGFNEFIDDAAAEDYGHKTTNWDSEGQYYRQVAGSELEPAMMWPSDWAGPLYTLQAYVKAPLALHALGGVVGDSAAHAAFSGYARAWRFRHPTPWDFFFFTQHQLGRDLGWFWNAWWFTTQTFDQGIESVTRQGNQVAIRITDHGEMAMPIILKLEFADGGSTIVRRPVSVWFSGARAATVTEDVGSKTLVRVTVDPDSRFQDVEAGDNVWTRP